MSDMRRRDFNTLLGGAIFAWPVEAAAQRSARVYRLGSITAVAPNNENSPFGSILLRELLRRGYTLGQNLQYEARGAMGRNDRLPELFREMKANGVEVVVCQGYPPAHAAKIVGIPTVVAFGAGDPVATGLVDGLARPGGHITGISDDAATLTTKRLGLLKEIAPRLRRVAMLWNKGDIGMTQRFEASSRVADGLGLLVQPLGVREPNDFDEAFVAMNQQPPDAILMVTDSLTNLNRKRVFEFAAERRLPAIYEYDFLVRDGGLMSYGPDLRESFERAAALVDRIFQGAKPADLPFEQPTRYPFFLNLKTAKSIGLEVPTALIAVADEVIE
jgi:putative tryptophan/tyrosine transport system substrate-binding protein